MRRRDRYIGLVWIKTLPGDPAEGRALPVPKDLLTEQQAMASLIGRFGLLVECELRDGFYTVRCTPQRDTIGAVNTYPAATYTGKCLLSLFSQAVLDYTAYWSDADLAVLSGREVIRWVA
jgi:hypothetical protein